MKSNGAIRVAGLDTLRAFAILSVMLYHFNWQMPPAFSVFSKFGWMGVDLFFVLSGYLIGSQLLKPVAAGKAVQLGSFYRARAYRILPAYLVVLALYVFVPVWRESRGMSPLWEFLTFTENLFVDYSKNQAFSHVWSLCVEEHFYLLFPLVVMWMSRGASLRKTASALGIILLAGMIVRCFVLFHTLRRAGADSEGVSLLYIEQIYYPTWTRLDGLLAGVSLALLRIFRPASWRRLARHGNSAAIVGAALVGLCVWMFDDRFSSASGAAAASSVVGFPLMSIGMALLVASATAEGSWLQKMRVPGAETTATLSFSLYLSHKGVAHLCRVYMPGTVDARNWLTVALLLTMWFTAAAVLYYGVERPFLTLRDHRAGKTVADVDAEGRVEPAL